MNKPWWVMADLAKPEQVGPWCRTWCAQMKPLRGERCRWYTSINRMAAALSILSPDKAIPLRQSW